MNQLKRRRVSLTLAGALMASAMAVPAAAQVTQERLENPEPENWLLPLGNYAGWSYSALNQINMDTVGGLRMIANIPIATALQDTTSQNLEGRPIVVDGMMYYNDAWGVMYGVDLSDPHNPRIAWITDPAMDREAGETLINRNGAVFGDRYYANLTDGRVVAVDINTGELVIDEQIARTEPNWEYDAGEGFTAPPLPVENMILVGQSKGDWGTRGFLAAVDGTTGEELWRTYTVPGPGEPGHETWADPEGTAWHTGGGSLWQVGAYDPATRLTIWGTANPVPMFDPEFRPGDNLYTNSAVAFNVDDGSINWYFQYTPNESWDYDEIGIHMLVDIDVGGETRQSVVHYARNGYYYRLDRVNGEFLSAHQWVDTVNWTDGIDEKTGLPIEYDPNLELQVYRPETRGLRDTLPTFDFCPTMLGGVRWQPTAYDPATRIHYVAGMDGCSNVTIQPADPVEGGGNPNGVGAVWLGGGDIATRGHTQDEPDGLMAGDQCRHRRDRAVRRPCAIRASRVCWRLPAAFSSMVAMTAGSRPTTQSTLAEVWGYNTGIRIKAAPMTFSVDGNQYVAVIAGAAGGGGGYPELANLQTGAMVFIFGLQ